MKQKHTFKPFDKVLYRYGKNKTWKLGLFSHQSGILCYLIGDIVIDNNRISIIPFEGNEDLLGTDKAPEEDIVIEEGEKIVVFDTESAYKTGMVRCFKKILKHTIVTTTTTSFSYCIPLSEFNPDNWEETRKNILQVINGKLTRL